MIVAIATPTSRLLRTEAAKARPPVRRGSCVCDRHTRPQHLTMQALANKCNVRVQPFTSASTRPSRVRVVRCQAQQDSHLQQVAAAVVAASCLCVPAAHAATDLIQPGVDVATAVGSGAAVAGLGALLVATDPQKRCVRNQTSSLCSLMMCIWS